MNNKTGFFTRIKKGLKKTRNSFSKRVFSVIGDRYVLDEEILEELEEIFIMSDMGIDTTTMLLSDLKKETKRNKLENGEQVKKFLKEKIVKILSVSDANNGENKELCKPKIILFVGVNGAGKTTTLGKLAYRFKKDGLDVIVAAGDTFRAAAIEQVEEWSRRTGCEIVKHKNGADPSAVIFDAISAAKARVHDILLIDTAGRLHTKKNLMDGLKKVKRVIAGEVNGAPHETFLVIDAGQGQNIIAQAREFHNAIGLTGLILTKLDGTSKGGIVVNVAHTLGMPVRYIGVGEGVEDLTEFNPSVFADALFDS